MPGFLRGNGLDWKGRLNMENLWYLKNKITGKIYKNISNAIPAISKNLAFDDKMKQEVIDIAVGQNGTYVIMEKTFRASCEYGEETAWQWYDVNEDADIWEAISASEYERQKELDRDKKRIEKGL